MIALLKSPARRCGAIFAATWLLACAAGAATISTNDQGVSIDCGALGTFILQYPSLIGPSGNEDHKIISKEPAGTKVIVEYEGGAIVRIEAGQDGQIAYHFEQMPSDVRKWSIVTMVDFSFAQGGKWKIGDSPETAFPVDKPARPHLYQGSATSLRLNDAQGESVTFHIPDYSYEELNDNRAWNWAIFAWVIHTPYNPDVKTYNVSAAVETVAKPGALVDAFGQIKALDWPGKVKSQDDLKADIKTEQDYYTGLAPEPPRDKYGGTPGSKGKLGLMATGFFHVEMKDGKWLLVDPDGDAFFQLGICGFAPGDDFTWVGGRRSTYEWLPPSIGEFQTAYREGMGDNVFSFYLANVIRKYGNPFDMVTFQARMIDRVRKWGFNSIGAFSPISHAVQTANFPYVAHLPLDEWTGNIRQIPGIEGTWDPFDEANRRQIDTNFAGVVAKSQDDALLIGYFLANEPIYEDIAKIVPSLKGSTNACKRALVQMLRDKYKTVDGFNAAWGGAAKSFDELEEMPLTVKTAAAAEDMHQFTGLFFETYFKLVSDTFHKYDSHHMLLGNRLQPGTINNEQLCRIAGKYLDVMSFNYYTDAVDAELLNRVQGWTGRPLLLSEFYWSSAKESGLLGGRDVARERDRGLAYRNYVEQTAKLGYVVGIEWFILIDQASTGRWFSKYNGERANTGLFSVADRPWKAMVEEMKKTNDGIYDVWLVGKKAYEFDDPEFRAGGNVTKASR